MCHTTRVTRWVVEKKWWYSQVSTNGRGRGVIKLIRLHQWIDMLWLPIFGAQLVILASPVLPTIPSSVCALLHLLGGFLWFNSYLRGLAIALSRSDNASSNPKKPNRDVKLFYRLYYLHQGRLSRYLKEEGLVRALYWSSPAVSALLMFLNVAENLVLHAERPSLFFYSYCAKTPFDSELLRELVVMKLAILCIFPSLFLELFVHVAIFVKQTKIESRATVFELRGGRLVSRQRHQGGDSIGLNASNSFGIKPALLKKDESRDEEEVT